MIFTISHYTIYDANASTIGATYDSAYISYSNYNGFLLFINPNITDVNDIPKTGLRGGIRLDDFAITIVLELGLFSKSQLTRH